MKPVEDHIEDLYSKYLYGESYSTRNNAKSELVDILSNYDGAEKLIHEKWNKATSSRARILFIYLLTLNSHEYKKEFVKYLLTNNEDYVATLFESLVEKYKRDPELFEETCEMILRMPRMLVSNIHCVFAFNEIAKIDLRYPDDLGPGAMNLRSDLKALQLPGIGIENTW